MKAWRWCRFEVVERRARFNLAKAEKRLHLVQGFLTALTDLDQVVKLIRAADDGQHPFTSCLLLQSCLCALAFTYLVLYVVRLGFRGH